jgi:predicted MPP superfamily phosphohydrolase
MRVQFAAAATLGLFAQVVSGGAAALAADLPVHHGVSNLREIWAIGDLHGDADCGRAWTERTGLVNLTTWEWTGGPDSLLVFLGDYIDRGPQSKGVLELVKNLTQTFPKQVVGLLHPDYPPQSNKPATLARPSPLGRWLPSSATTRRSC